jgi:hypothetical protein
MPPSIEVQLVMAAMATWRLTHLLVEEDGPGDVVVRLRKWLGDGVAGKAMDCFFCSSLWASAVFASCIARDPLTWGLLWFGLSGAACLIERATARPAHSGSPVLPTSQQHHPRVQGDSHVVLRSTTPGSSLHDAEPGSYSGVPVAGPARSDTARLSR